MVDNIMILLLVFYVKDVKVLLVFCLLIKYIVGYGNVLGGVVVDIGNFDWIKFDNFKFVYQVVDIVQWGIIQIKKKGLCDLGVILVL